MHLFKIKGLAMIEGRPGRVSFRWNDLPDSAHVTLSWDSPDYVNIHITRRVKGCTEPFRADVALWSKRMSVRLVDALYIGLSQALFEERYFQFSSRRNCKKYKVLFLDKMEQGPIAEKIKKNLHKTIKRHSDTEKKGLKSKQEKTILKASFFAGLINSPFINSVKRLLRFHLQPLCSDTFAGVQTRTGFLKKGRTVIPFISQQGHCYVLRKGISLNDLLSSFLAPDLAGSLLSEFEHALEIVVTSQTPEECEKRQNPIELYFNDEYSDGFIDAGLK